MTSPSKILRCAVYTRKSSEEGLEQSFNSLHAQREACEAYIKSQQSEGWQVLRDMFDDGGFSGGTLERPALTRLLDGVQAGVIDVVVVYKVDRLSRSLSDFIRIIELFEKHAVSFVSVTQHFNTPSSMGRLTLNVLLSFAQFEREVGAERIRDKVAASKKKGMWMGGNVPLGYDIKDKRLVINPKEAKLVQTIFEQYLVLQSVRSLKAHLDENRSVSKRRVSKAGRSRGGSQFSRGALYTLLSNPLYIGKIKHKTVHYPAPHTPIISHEVWERVQRQLVAHQQSRTLRTQAKHPSLLAGLLFDDRGHAMSPSFTTKGNRRYGYYVSQALLQYKDREAGSLPRIPANEIESPVLSRLEQLFSSPIEVLELIGRKATAAEMVTLKIAMQERKKEITSSASHPKIALLKKLIHHLVVNHQEIRIDLRIDGLMELLGIKNNEGREYKEGDRIHAIRIPVVLRRSGREVKLILTDLPAETQTRAHSMMVTHLRHALKRAIAWNEALLTGKMPTLAHIARHEKLTQRHVANMIRLAFLSPDIQEAILQGDVPASWRVQRFREEIPLRWEEQRQRFPLNIPA